MPLICSGHLTLVLCLTVTGNLSFCKTTRSTTGLIHRNLFLRIKPKYLSCNFVFLVLSLKAKRVSLYFFSYFSMWSLFTCVVVVILFFPFFMPSSPVHSSGSVCSIPLHGPCWYRYSKILVILLSFLDSLVLSVWTRSLRCSLIKAAFA